MTNTDNSINILQWNARSAIANKLPLQNFLISHKVHIALISETFFKPLAVVKFKGFNVVRRDRESGKGGVAILIANNIKYDTIRFNNVNLENLVEICGIKTTINGRQLSFISLYKPPKITVSSEIWESFFNNLEGECIIGGDFNAHHGVWGANISNSHGNHLVNALNASNLIVVNDGSATRITPPNIQKSAVDITILTPGLVTQSNWEILNDSMGSDHFPILIKVNHGFPKNTVYPSRKWRLSKANWTTFRESLDNFILVTPPLVNNATY